MPALNFKKQFAPLVESGQKRQTIRAKRRDGRNPHIGDTLYLFCGLRTKSCRRLGQAVCLSVEEIHIDWTGINVAGDWIAKGQEAAFARADGFSSLSNMYDYFNKEHTLPFDGLLLKW